MSKALSETVVKSVHAKYFLLVVIYTFNRIKSHQSGIITAHSKVADQLLTNIVSTLIEDQMKVAAHKRTKAIEDTVSVGIFVERLETSCKAIGYLPAATRYNRRLMYAICSRHGTPGVFFALAPDDEYCFRVRLWENNGQQFDLVFLECTDKQCIADFQLRKNT